MKKMKTHFWKIKKTKKKKGRMNTKAKKKTETIYCCFLLVLQKDEYPLFEIEKNATKKCEYEEKMTATKAYQQLFILVYIVFFCCVFIHLLIHILIYLFI